MSHLSPGESKKHRKASKRAAKAARKEQQRAAATILVDTYPSAGNVWASAAAAPQPSSWAAAWDASAEPPPAAVAADGSDSSAMVSLVRTKSQQEREGKTSRRIHRASRRIVASLTYTITRLLCLPIDRERAEEELAAHAELHDDLDSEIEAVMAEMAKVSASVSFGGSAAIAAGVGGSGVATSASDAARGGTTSSMRASKTSYDDQWDKYDNYGE